ncbi:CheA signal transduction histidine kinase [Alkaliphilus metalliredigens QYMF]|uniref:Chemotaxis protein CheA n=1 Tax=Alkaliphilus metalliredigens (strain QYMF) TaxID=293826 RepID=A6TRN2_ALKMQ|nr:chemotaxis protein CheA [Alkaliphilus metalliredigens]ABR48850.1 CheA signal transduction histidine kinase [Alkaliphilus metalliredigens QYMF]
MDMNQYLEIFIEESKENLQNMNTNLLSLENSLEDMNLLNEIFRIAHTLKGMSATMGYKHIAQLTHEMENVLHSIRSNEMSMTAKVVDLLFECFDRLEKYINEVELSGSEGTDSPKILIDKFHLLTVGGPEVTIQVQQSEEPMGSDTLNGTIKLKDHTRKAVHLAMKEGITPYSIKVILDENCMLKSARAYIIINALDGVSEIIQSEPSIEDIEDEKFDLSFELVVLSKVPVEEIERELNEISDIEFFSVIDLKNQLEDNLHEDQIVNYEDGKNKETIEEMKAQQAVTVTEAGTEKNEVKEKRSKTGKTVRVDIDRLDNLMNLVSELIIIKTRLEDIGDDGKRQNMNEATEHLERITTSLHDAVMKVRMVPIERVFNRFPRMVRDLSKDLGKEISLVLSGEETEVDRTVIDEIGDPLIHLIRNSIDHGIEDPEYRMDIGKSKSGTVKLIAYPDGNSVVIEITDDGQGVNILKVKEKAVERGLVNAEQADLMDDKEAVELLFTAGFSTADKVSDVSGRGVGLDVVKTKIESLGGAIEVDSQKGKGSKFIIRLPLTLAIIQALLVIVGNEKYAIPLSSIKEITTISQSHIRKVQNNEIILYRNETLPILRLSNLLGASNADIEEDEATVVIVKKGDKTVGLVVNELIGQQEIVIKSLGKFLGNVQGVAGATILGNGTVALIIDTNSYF